MEVHIEPTGEIYGHTVCIHYIREITRNFKKLPHSNLICRSDDELAFRE